MKHIILFFIVILFFGQLHAQIKTDSIPENPETNIKLKSFIIPATLMTVGIIGLESHTLLDINDQLKDEVHEHIDKKLTIDDFTQYTPVALVYGLDACGVKAKHNFKERTKRILTAHAIMTTTVLILKSSSTVLRPDGSSYNSFPSGHTATAFMSAEFLWQEYKDKSVWYGILGYTVAAGTGIFRVYNDRHWFNDILMGAGIGMFCTKLTYWLHPFVTKKLFHKEKTQAVVVPFYNGEQFGLGAVFRM